MSCALTLSLASVTAQEFPISTSPTIQTCQGVLLDSGGNAGEYDDNEGFLTTICPEAGQPAISLDWVIFNLSTGGQPTFDRILIYDGNTNDVANLIGTWSGTNSPGIVSAGFSNPTGCLTVEFFSNEAGTGNFAANISCFQPCEPPTAVATLPEQPFLTCVGETITFDASQSFAATGFNIISYTWDFDDASSATGPVVSHAFAEPGEYIVQVEVQDDNDCVNTNAVSIQIWVSTQPDFSAMATNSSFEICFGEELQLSAEGLSAVEWSELPDNNFGGSLALPDLQGVPFNTSISYTLFEPDQIITSANDIESLCVSMEHSYMGDLVISLICPNGQSIDLHQQGGGGTYIGGANDTDIGAEPVLGECWDYCWSPTATLGTFATESATNTVLGGNPPNEALVEGTYSSVEPFSDLVGCPLNGTWTFRINDLFGADNGFICDWQLNLDPDLFPDLTEFTPVNGISVQDSASWSGPNVVVDPTNPLLATAVINGPGVFEYVFSVTNNFGCSFDTTIVVTVQPAPIGPITISGDSVLCENGVAVLSVPQGYETYSWSPGAVSSATISTTTPGDYVATVAIGDCAYTTDAFTVVSVAPPTPVITGDLVICGEGFSELTTQDPYASYLWSTGSTESPIYVGPGTYFVIVTDTNGCNATSAPVTVITAPVPNAGFAVDPLSPVPVGTTATFLDTSSVDGDVITSWWWQFDDETTSDVQFPVNTFDWPGIYTIALAVTTSQGCTDTVFFAYEVLPPDIVIPNVFTPNGDGINDLLEIVNLQYYPNELTVFDRWGKKVLDTRNYNNAWRAADVQDGTYFFVLNLTDEGREFKGHITILR